MTAEKMRLGTERLRQLPESRVLSKEALNALDSWWRGVIRREQNKVVSLDEWRSRRRWLP